MEIGTKKKKKKKAGGISIRKDRKDVEVVEKVNLENTARDWLFGEGMDLWVSELLQKLSGVTVIHCAQALHHLLGRTRWESTD